MFLVVELCNESFMPSCRSSFGLQIIRAFIYVDDSFSFAKAGDLTFYVKYQKKLPTDMVRLLLLWDELGIPHEE
jgi:hypothetical protein